MAVIEKLQTVQDKREFWAVQCFFGIYKLWPSSKNFGCANITCLDNQDSPYHHKLEKLS